LQIVLVLGFSFPEITRWGDFSDDFAGPKTRGIHILNRIFCNSLLLFSSIKNRRAIAGPAIVALAVYSCGIVNLEEELQEISKTDFLRIKDDLDRFGMRAMIAIGCVRNISSGVTNACRNDPVFAAN